MTETFYPTVVREMDDAEGGGFMAIVLDLPGCFSDGSTPEEAVANARDAALEWRDEAARLGRDVPAPGSVFARAEREADALSKQQELIEAQAKLIDALRAQLDALTANHHSTEDPRWHGLLRNVTIAASRPHGDKDVRTH